MSDWTEYVGIPFRYGGRDRKAVDCYGLVRMVLRERFSVTAPDYIYPDAPEHVELADVALAAERDGFWSPVVKYLAPGDVVLLRANDLPTHCGIIIDKQFRMLHAQAGTCSCIERLTAPKWKNRIVGYYRARGLPDG